MARTRDNAESKTESKAELKKIASIKDPNARMLADRKLDKARGLAHGTEKMEKLDKISGVSGMVKKNGKWVKK